jgi:hypothetical protein
MEFSFFLLALAKTGCEVVDWIILAEDKVQRQVLGNFGFHRRGVIL